MVKKKPRLRNTNIPQIPTLFLVPVMLLIANKHKMISRIRLCHNWGKEEGLSHTSGPL